METPTGEFNVDRKYPSRHMGDGGLTGDLRAYELVGVPWVSFFHSAGIAFHGTWWHDNFGVPMSQGCVNLRNEDALWLFRWTSPSHPGYEPDASRPPYLASGSSGTAVIVQA
jgi:lipoprotein-anchoring transpeptidase ErfK/SrfK